MAMQLKIDVPGGEMQITGNDDKDIFRKAAFWQGLPTVCPIDGSPTKLEFRSPQDYEYYMVVSTGDFQYEYKLGIHNNQEKTLFNKGKWTYYDPEAVGENGRKGAEIVVAEYGKVYEDRLPRGGMKSRPSPSTTTNPDPQDYQPQQPAAPDAGQQAGENANLLNARKYVAKKLNDAGIPEQLRGAILTSMLNRPVQNDVNRVDIQDARDLREYLKNIPDGIERAWEDLKSTNPEAAAADGSDLDDEFPDFLE